MSVSHEHFNFWFVEIGADFDQLLKLSIGELRFYLITRGFNWELELNMKVAQSPYERKGYSHF